MSFSFFRTNGVWPEGLSLVRIVCGLLLIVHGMQMFDATDMRGYGDWLNDIGLPASLQLAYAGKAVELVGGFLLLIGLYTSVATAILFFTFIFITVVMGKGKVLTDAQHPFLFAMLSAIFFFVGPGKWSVDRRFRP